MRHHAEEVEQPTENEACLRGKLLNIAEVERELQGKRMVEIDREGCKPRDRRASSGSISANPSNYHPESATHLSLRGFRRTKRLREVGAGEPDSPSGGKEARPADRAASLIAGAARGPGLPNGTFLLNGEVSWIKLRAEPGEKELAAPPYLRTGVFEDDGGRKTEEPSAPPPAPCRKRELEGELV